MSGHGHNHEASSDKGDIYTKLATVIGGVADIATCFYYVSELIALLDGSEDSTSTHAQVAGAIASLPGFISMYTHYKLYTFHQTATPKDSKVMSTPDVQGEDEESLLPEQERPRSRAMTPISSSKNVEDQGGYQAKSVPSTTPLLAGDSTAHQHNHDGKRPTKPKRRKCSKGLQQAALVSDGVNHTLGLSGTLAAVINGVAGGRFGFWGKVAVHSASLAVGFLGSVAQVRNEADALKKLAESEEDVVEQEYDEERAQSNSTAS